MKHWKSSLCIFLGGICLPNLELRAASVSLHPVADTTIQQAYPNNNFGDGTTLTVGGRRKGGATRALLEFDLSSVPAGSTINSVTLSLSVTQTPSGGISSTFEVHKLLDSWGEGSGSDHGGSLATAGSATWNVRSSPGTAWTTAGGDIAQTISASASIIGTGVYSFSGPDLVTDVQNWLNDPTSNDGWLLKSGSESTATTIRRLGGRNDGTFAPTLTINYTPVPEPGTWFLFGFLGSVVLFWGRMGEALNRSCS